MTTNLILLMNTWLGSGMILGFVLGLILLFLVVSYKIWAPQHKFFTFGHENWAMHVQGNGTFKKRIILPSHTYYVDKNFDRQEYSPYPRLAKQQRRKYGHFTIWNMIWVGIPPWRTVKYRHQVWQEWETKKREELDAEGRKKTITYQELRLRDEHTPYLIVKPFAYGMFLSEAETKGNLAVDIGFTAILQPTNLYKPVYGPDDAYRQVQNIIMGAGLLYVKMETFESLLSESRTANAQNLKKTHIGFSNFIKSLNKQIPGLDKGVNLKTLYGYEIIGVSINGIEIAGANRKMVLEATTKAYIAEQDKKAAILAAEGQGQAIELLATSKSKAIRTEAEAEAFKAEVYYAKIKDNPAAIKIEIEKARFQGSSKVTTYVEGNSSTTPTIPLK